jgi:pimeloyl-ACP methyl ester carboxylesterase
MLVWGAVTWGSVSGIRLKSCDRLGRVMTLQATSVSPDDPGRMVQAGNLRVHYVERGHGPLVVMLHGFPECWWGWQHQIGPLADAGLRIVAPDLRGYNRTERPSRGYDIETLTADVRNLVDVLGERRCSLVGHDWGGVIAWLAAMRYPEMVERLAILNAPHPATYLREIRHPGKFIRSWYVGLFGIPGLPEWLLSRDRCAGVASIFRSSSTRADTFSSRELAAYRDIWCQPGALTAALSYYRQLIRLGRRGLMRRIRPIRAPTLVLWGMRDVALSPSLLDGLERWVPDVELARFPDAGHWVQHEAVDEVNSRLAKFLTAGAP